MNIVVHFCDRCSASIPEKDVVEKAAFIRPRSQPTSGAPAPAGRALTLCSTCRRALGGGTGDPEIFFCEGCGRSVSVPELESGSVSVVTGRLLCSTCRPVDVSAAVPSPIPASVAPPIPLATAPQGARSKGGIFAVLAVIGLLAAGAAGVALFVPSVREALEARGLISRRAAPADVSVPDRAAVPAATAADVRELRDALDRLDESVRGLSAKAPDDGVVARRIDALEARLLEAAQKDSDAIGAIDASIGDLRALIADFRGEIDAAKMLAAIPNGDLVPDGDASSPARESREAESPRSDSLSEAAAPAPASSPDRDRWIADLAAEDSGKRFTAIVELARLRDASAIPALGKTLANDPDIYCRTEAGRTLGEFRDYAAVPFLIAALRDRESMVATTASDSLKLITSKTFGFTNKSTPQERRESISRWESWWEKAKDTAPASGATKH